MELLPFFLRLDAEKVIYSFLSHLNVEILVHIVDGEVVVIVDDAMLREHLDLGGCIIFGFDLKQFAVPGIGSGVDSINFLDGLFFTVHKVICFTVLSTSFCNELEFEDVVAGQDGIFDRGSLYEKLPDCICDNDGVVIYIESTRRGDTSNKVAAFGLCAAIVLDFNVVVDILLDDLMNDIFFQQKPSALLPFIVDGSEDG